MELLLDPENLKTLGTVLGAAALFLIRTFLKERAAKTERVLQENADFAYDIIEAVAKRTPNKLDDKALLGLAAVRDQLAQKGLVLRPEQEVKVRELFTARSEREKAARALADELALKLLEQSERK